MRFFMRILTVFLFCFVCVFSSVALSDSDGKINIENDIDTDFLVDYIEEDGPVYLVLFFSLTSDDGFFMLDDIANSNLIQDEDINIVAVDISSSDEEIYNTFISIYENTNITFTQASKALAELFASKVELEGNLITYPISVIIDPQFKIRHVLNGYKGPDAVLELIEEIKIENETAKQLWATSSTDKGVNLRWRTSPDVSSYTVYKALTADGEYLPVFTTYDNKVSAFTDSDVLAGDKFYYKIGSTKLTADDTLHTEETENLEVEVRLSTPSNLELSKKLNNQILISWDYSENIESYFIYKSPTPAGNFVLYTEISGENTTFTDQTENGEAYYKVKAFDGRNFSKIAYPIYSFKPSATLK